VFSGGASLEAAERVCVSDAVKPAQVLELLTALVEKSLLVAEGVDGDSAPRYRMLGTIKEYAGQQLAAAGESDLARQAHLAYFIELTEAAEPNLRRAEQLGWLATLSAEHDNIGAAMRGALTAGEAQAAMRLAAGSGWYWWLAGHKTEGLELLTAAAGSSGEVTDEIRATVYALVAHFLSSGRGDQHKVAEWIHKAYELGQRSQSRDPRLEFVAPLERMLREPDGFLSAFDPLLDSEDPWVRAQGRLLRGKMRIVLGQDDRAADAHLEQALAEFRALGERYGISLALSELADRIAVRGELARACEHYEEAIAIVMEFGAIDDAIRMRAQQAQVFWLLGDQEASAAAIAEAQRYAERVTWPDALAELALSKAQLARWAGQPQEAYQQLGIATALLGDQADDANIVAMRHNLLGYLTDDLGEVRAHRAEACAAASQARYAPLIAHVVLGVADLALRLDQFEQAARLLAASVAVRGLPDLADPDAARIEQAARRRLGDARFAEATLEGTQTGWPELVEITCGRH
jgi:hypothetical protein